MGIVDIILILSQIGIMLNMPKLTGKGFPQFFKGKKAGYLVLAVFLLIGVFTFRDYGISTDELRELYNSVINYKYIISLVNNINIIPQQVKDNLNNSLFDEFPDLHDWEDRFYGTAVMFPTVFVEAASGFTMEADDLFRMRHLYNYLNFIAAALCFFLLLHKRFKDSYVPLFGLLMLLLYPRFFAEAFYNLKDILFASWFVISVYFMFRLFERKSFANSVLAGLVLAVSANTRIIGIVVLLLAYAFFAAEILTKREKENVKLLLKTVLTVTVSFFVFYVIFTPASWRNPFVFFIDAVSYYMYSTPWEHTHLYMGEMITKHVPWHYVPVWMFISIPVFYTVFFFIGNAGTVKTAVKKIRERSWTCGDKLFVYDLFNFLLFWCTLAGLIILKAVLYEGWRHVYFLFIPFLYTSAAGLYHAKRYLEKFKYLIYLPYTLMILTLVFSARWLIVNHPYGNLYLNIPMKNYAGERFTRDAWALTQRESVEYILKTDDGKNITYMTNALLFLANLILPQEQVSRIQYLEHSVIPPDYHDKVMFWFDNEPKNEFPGFRVYRTIKVDGIDTMVTYKYLISEDMFKDDYMEKIINIEYFENDQMVINFSEPVDSNLFRLVLHEEPYYILLQLHTSMDGENWREAELLFLNGIDFIMDMDEYRHLRVVRIDSGNNTGSWQANSILRFGYIDSTQISEIIN